MNGLGIRQRRMIQQMATFGGGRWPPGWRQRSDDRTVLDTLVSRGLVTSAAIDTHLTDEGAKIAASLSGHDSHTATPRLAAHSTA